MYKIKEIYYTLQGEGFHAGRPAVFCRFTGCNLWTGLEKDRAKAICNFCDTDFRGMDGEHGGSYSAEELVAIVDALYYGDCRKYVVFTGGEPALQMDTRLVDTFHDAGFEIAIETNGTLALPQGIDWVCVSPKSNTDIVINKGNELKLVYPQEGMEPRNYAHMDFEYFFLQPKENTAWSENTAATIEYVKKHPKWRLSTQTHKFLSIQ